MTFHSPNHRAGIILPPLAALLAAGALAVAAPGAAQALPDISYQSCAADLRDKIRKSVEFMLERTGPQREALTRCVDRAYLVEHQRASPERIVSDLRRPDRFRFRCRNLGDANASAHRVYRRAGVMNIDRGFVRENSKAEIAGTIAHEIMHNSGFSHSSNDFGSTLYDNTVPEQVEACVTSLTPNPYEGDGEPRYVATDMVGFAVDGENNYVFAWSKDGTVSAGSTTRIHNYRHPYPYTLAPGLPRRQIVGMGLDGYNNTVFAWLRNGTVVAGSSDDLDSKRAPYRYSLPPGYSPDDIVGMAVDGENNYNFAFYRDGKVSAGTSDDLDRFRAPYRYSLPPGYTPADIVGMALDGENNWVFAFYDDGTVSAGSSDDLDRFRAPERIITGR